MFKNKLNGGLLIAAMGAAIVSQGTWASNNSGAISGTVTGGENSSVTIENNSTGRTVTISTNEDGNFRVGNLPIGTYTVTSNGESREIRVQIGSDSEVSMGLALEEVIVLGGDLSPIIDMRTSETALNIDAVELSRLPMPQNVTAVALLAPGTTAGDGRFGNYASFGGSSVAENSMYINGLNVTNFRNGLGFSNVPYEFYKEFQVKTGGYSAEFGRSTGGVVNAVTKSGSNEFEFGINIRFDPSSLRETSPNTILSNDDVYIWNAEDSVDKTNLSLSASGPIIEDKLFFYAMYNPRDVEQEDVSGQGSNFSKLKQDDAFWGAKIDWQISDNHLIEYLAFSDSNDVVSNNYGYDVDTQTVGAYQSTSTEKEGGDNWSVKYSGQLTDNLGISALIGENKYNLTSSSNVQDDCALLYDIRDAAPNGVIAGCASTSDYFVEVGEDTREAMRFDAEWSLGDHLLRFGYDEEVNTSFSEQRYSGPDGMYWVFYDTTPGAALANGATIPAGVTEYVRSRMRTVGGNFETVASAFYVEDIWDVSDNLTLTLGLRNEMFENKNSQGDTFVKIDDMVAPRLGISWDFKGDGNSKIFASAGRYFLPVANNTNVRLSGNENDYRDYYQIASTSIGDYNGIPVMDFVLGAQIGETQVNADGEVPDVTVIVDQDLDPMYQDEYVIGYQAMINDSWNWGVKYTKRDMNGAIDDMLIDRWHENKYGCGAFDYVLGNPGKEMTIGANPSCDHDTVVMETVSGADIGYPEAERHYKAIEFTLARDWDDQWSLDASYTYSKSEGNSEGLVKSDNAQEDAGLTQDFDLIDLMDGAYGYLPNDRRHMIKARGVYSVNDALSVSAKLRVESGRPTNAFGIGHPNGVPDYGDTYYVCTSDCEGNNPTYTFTPRGTFGRTPWTMQLDLGATYDMNIANTDIRFSLTVYNLFDASNALRVNEEAEESSPGQANPKFGAITGYQTPRYVSFGVNASF